MNRIWALRSRLEKQPTYRRRKPCYLWDRTLGRLCFCDAGDDIGLLWGDSRTGHEPKLGGPSAFLRFSKPVDCQRVLALSNSVHRAGLFLLIAFNHQFRLFFFLCWRHAFVGAGSDSLSASELLGPGANRRIPDWARGRLTCCDHTLFLNEQPRSLKGGTIWSAFVVAIWYGATKQASAGSRSSWYSR